MKTETVNASLPAWHDGSRLAVAARPLLLTFFIYITAIAFE
jgi:hypothetical protein